MVPYLLPAGWVAEVPLAEDDPVERSRELQVHRHPALLAGDVQARDLRHVGWAALGASHAPVNAAALAERLDLTQAKLKHEAVIRDLSQSLESELT